MCAWYDTHSQPFDAGWLGPALPGAFTLNLGSTGPLERFPRTIVVCPPKLKLPSRSDGEARCAAVHELAACRAFIPIKQDGR